MAGLSKREMAVVLFMIEGKSGSCIARKLKVSDSTIQGAKRKLAVKIQEHMGFDILAQVRRQPQWKQDLEAVREKMACKYDRLH